MSTNRFFWIWAIRSRAIVFLGILLTAAPFSSDPIGQLPYASLISVFGILLVAIGVLDGFGRFQRKKVRLAIQAHDRAARGLAND